MKGSAVFPSKGVGSWRLDIYISVLAYSSRRKGESRSHTYLSVVAASPRLR